MNFGKITLIIALAFFLSGCAPTVDLEPTIAETQTPTTEETQAPTISVDQPTEPTAVETLPTEPVLPVTVYAGAIEDYLLPLDNYSSQREHAPEMVMIHFTSAVMLDRNDPYNMELVRSIFEEYQVSPHYIIQRDGTILCYIPEDRVAWHAGKGTWQNDEKFTNAMNQYAIGIELVAMGSQSDMSIYLTQSEYAALDQSLMGFTEAQYVALSELINDLCQRYDIPLDRQHVIGHDEYSPSKTDPGELFDWEKLIP